MGRLIAHHGYRGDVLHHTALGSLHWSDSLPSSESNGARVAEEPGTRWVGTEPVYRTESVTSSGSLAGGCGAF